MMSAHRLQGIRNRLDNPIHSHKETCRGQEPLVHRPHPIRRQEANVVALEQGFHPLGGLKSAYYVAMSEPLESIASPIRRFLIRLIYFKWQWYSGQSVHDMGIFTDRDVAEAVAQRKRDETGKAWSVKELPVNGLLPERAVQYGFYSFPGSKADSQYRNRVTRFIAVPRRDLAELTALDNKLGKLQDRIEGKSAKAS